MKHLLSLIICAFISISTWAQTQQQRPFEGQFYSSELGIDMYLNLYEETLEVPGFSFLGKMNGYMRGSGIYGTWMIIKATIKNDNTAIIRFSNDVGSDSQDIEFKMKADSTYSYRTIDGNAIRKAVGRKLVKIPGETTFKRVH